VARRINRERLVVLGWPSAILRQVAHPLIAAGVAGHSNFREGGLAGARRLRGTIQAMLGLTFGDQSRRDEVLSHIRGIHMRVRGTLDTAAGPFPAGTPYAAGDPALLLWVHATLLDSIVRMYQQVVAPLGASERDAFCAESAATAVALGADPARIPLTWAALGAYIDGVHRSGTLAVTPAGREVADAVLSPRLSGVRLPAAGLHRLITVGLLPDVVRDAYGFRWDGSRQRRLTRVFRTLRAARRLSPDWLATWKWKSGSG
jgi:uncharacterized protein (DUF2236 family)